MNRLQAATDRWTGLLAIGYALVLQGSQSISLLIVGRAGDISLVFVRTSQFTHSRPLINSAVTHKLQVPSVAHRTLMT